MVLALKIVCCSSPILLPPQCIREKWMCLPPSNFTLYTPLTAEMVVGAWLKLGVFVYILAVWHLHLVKLYI